MNYKKMRTIMKKEGSRCTGKIMFLWGIFVLGIIGLFFCIVWVGTDLIGNQEWAVSHLILGFIFLEYFILLTLYGYGSELKYRGDIFLIPLGYILPVKTLYFTGHLIKLLFRAIGRQTKRIKKKYNELPSRKEYKETIINSEGSGGLSLPESSDEGGLSVV